MNTLKPRVHQNSKVAELRSHADPSVVSKTRKSMLLAAKIEDALTSKKLNKSSFAKLMDVQPSVITKWLSGTHNFTTDTLFEIEHKLGIKLVSIDDDQRVIHLSFHIVVNQNNPVEIPAAYDPWNLIDYNQMSHLTSAIKYSDIHSLNYMKKRAHEY